MPPRRGNRQQQQQESKRQRGDVDNEEAGLLQEEREDVQLQEQNNNNNKNKSSRFRRADQVADVAAGGDDDATTTSSSSSKKNNTITTTSNLPSAIDRHHVDDKEAPQRNDDEEDEEWEDDETESDEDDLPEEIIDEGEMDEEEEDEEGEETNAVSAFRNVASLSNNNNNNNNNQQQQEGGEGNNNNQGEDLISRDGPTVEVAGGKKVRFVGPLNNDDEPIARVYRSDREQNKDPNVNLTYSNRAYESFFQLRTEHPALSFSVLRDFDGDCRTKFPMSMYLACGTQATKKNENQIVLLQLSNLVRTRNDEASDSDDEEEIGMTMEDDSDSERGDKEDDDENAVDADAINNGEAIVNSRTIAFPGVVNRLRTKEDAPNIIAAWCDDGTVRVMDAIHDARALADFSNWSKERAANWDKEVPNPHVFCSSRREHRTEGYGLAWAREGDLSRFASGDCNGAITIWGGAGSSGASSWAAEAGWSRDGAQSVEEITWSAVEPSVFVAARAGGLVEIWDTRDMRSCRIQFRADPTDINVADWNRAMSNSHLLLTGADSGIISVWDLRKVRDSQPMPLQRLTFHEGNKITSLEFSVHNETVLAATSDDGQCTLWDLCVERDIDEEREMVGSLFGRPDVSELPDALMFQHQGLYHPKECHFHPQIPGAVVTTDYQGLHIFKPCNWKSLMK